MVKVLCHGCWDILHAGHLEHFRRAKSFGDHLIVSVSSDEVVKRHKGPGRPINSIAARVEMLESLRTIDEVFVCLSDDASDAILQHRPNYFVAGIDYRHGGLSDSELRLCNLVGATIQFTDHQKIVSTSSIIERIKCAS